MQNSITTINNERIIDLEKTAVFLGISTATVRNWVKCGNLKTFGNSRYNFYLSEIQNLKADITSGNLKKLNGRANKSKAERTFMPEEYLKVAAEVDGVAKIIIFIKENKIDVSTALLFLVLNLLQKENIASNISIQNLFGSQSIFFKNKQIGKEIKSWLLKIKTNKIEQEYSFLLNCHIPKQRDILGLIYQSLLFEGQKSQKGLYYTPEIIVNEIIKDHAKKDSKVLDPCCGTGQFLLSFADIIDNPNNIYGVDVDEIAVRIARLNILIKYRNQNFIPNIVCKNTLFEIGNYDLFNLNDENIKDFDVIATNPPWGVHFSKGDMEKLKNFYPTITSFESFSYFIKKSFDLLRSGGVVSFILPESILNVRTHKDIREIILKNSQIKKIAYLGRVFENVFTAAIRLDFKKTQKRDENIKICEEKNEYNIAQTRWLNNQDFIFDIHANGFDTEIIKQVYQIKHITLRNNANWALGIVTGNNKKFIIDEKKCGYEAIYKGKDIKKFILSQPSGYVKFTPEKFQQVAPEEKYRAKEKLIYRFISKYLIFAYDDQQKLTLNSANVVIPKVDHYPIKVIAALFNSSLYQFIFQKKFSSIKVLRSHIEQMPLPIWDSKIYYEIIKLTDETIKDKNNFEKLDNYIIGKFDFSPKEKIYIKEFNK